MRKVDDGKKEKKKKENNVFLVATNVVASRPPERRPTGTPQAGANLCLLSFFFYIKFFYHWIKVLI